MRDKHTSMAVTVDDDRGEVAANRKVRRSGGSYVVSLPPEILEVADFGPDDDVVVSRKHESGAIELRLAENQGKADERR